MKVECSNCKSENPADGRYCVKCGYPFNLNKSINHGYPDRENAIDYITQSKIPSIMNKLPSWAYITIIILCFLIFISSIILFFAGLAYIEGFASILFLISAIGFLLSGPRGKSSNFVKGLGILFFALMGMAIDQPGNILYNKPIEYIFCKKNSTLTREVQVSHPVPGRTDMIQDFNCVDSNGNIENSISSISLIGIRFFEYIILGYFLVWITGIYYSKRQK